MQQIIQARLTEIQQPRKANNRPVHGTEGPKPKDFGAVVGHGGVIEGTVQNEQNDVGVSGEHAVRDHAQHADGGGGCDESRQDGHGGGAVEDGADEGDR